MKNKTLITHLTGEDMINETLIPTGLTNHNLHITTTKNEYVLRLPKPENKDLFNYHHEDHVLQLIKELDLEPPLISFNPSNGIKLSQYIPNAHTLDETHYLDAVNLIAKLHNANLHSGESFDLLNKYDLYTCDEPIYDLQSFHHYIEDAHTLSSHQRLCHNDCVEGNFLFTSDRHYLIDFEYASDNDPYFDLLSLITENDITDQSTKEEMIKHYFSLVEIPYDQKKLHIFEGALHTLWCAWACKMYDTFKKPIFKEIADLKYQRLIQLKTNQT